MNFQLLDGNNSKIRAAIEGEGPLVVLVHGWPESWYSWRHQIEPLANAGFKVAAVDVRGYGGSDKPHEIKAYSLKNLAAILGFRHEDMSGNVEEDEEGHRVWNPDQGSVIEFPEGGWKLGVGDRKTSIGLFGHAPGNHHDPKGDNEGSHLAVGHKGP